MKRVTKWGLEILICGLLLSGIAYLGHKQPFHPTTPLEESQANHNVITRKAFKKIRFNIPSTNIIIKQGRSYSVSYYGSRTTTPHVRVTDGNLELSQPTVKNRGLFSGRLSNNDRCVITVPKDKTLTAIQGNFTANLVLSQIAVRKASLTTTNSNIAIKNSTIEGGKINNTSGNLAVRHSSLLNTKLSSASGNISLKRVSLTKGQATLSSGNFSAQHLTIIGHYTVSNKSGNNSVTKSSIDGAKLTTESGMNRLRSRSRTGGTLSRNDDVPNVLFLKNASGNNTLKN